MQTATRPLALTGDESSEISNLTASLTTRVADQKNVFTFVKTKAQDRIAACLIEGDLDRLRVYDRELNEEPACIEMIDLAVDFLRSHGVSKADNVLTRTLYERFKEVYDFVLEMNASRGIFDGRDREKVSALLFTYPDRSAEIVAAMKERRLTDAKEIMATLHRMDSSHRLFRDGTL